MARDAEGITANLLHRRLAMKPFVLSLALLAFGARAEPGAPRVIGHWDFDEVADGRVPDRSGHGRHGRIHGSPVRVEGIAGNALRFQSNDDFMRLLEVLRG